MQNLECIVAAAEFFDTAGRAARIARQQIAELTQLHVSPLALRVSLVA